MNEKFDKSELSEEADKLIQRFQKDAANQAGIFHHLITLPTYHDTALGTHVLAEGYFGDKGMLAYVKEIQRKEIRGDLASVKHQDLAGSPPHISQSPISPIVLRPPQDPAIGFLPNTTPIDMAMNIRRRILKVIRTVLIS